MRWWWCGGTSNAVLRDRTKGCPKGCLEELIAEFQNEPSDFEYDELVRLARGGFDRFRAVPFKASI